MEARVWYILLMVGLCFGCTRSVEDEWMELHFPPPVMTVAPLALSSDLIARVRTHHRSDDVSRLESPYAGLNHDFTVNITEVLYGDKRKTGQNINITYRNDQPTILPDREYLVFLLMNPTHCSSNETLGASPACPENHIYTGDPARTKMFLIRTLNGEDWVESNMGENFTWCRNVGTMHGTGESDMEISLSNDFAGIRYSNARKHIAKVLRERSKAPEGRMTRPDC